MGYENIPLELRALRQWVVCGDDKIPLNPRTSEAASVSDPETWGTFEEACSAGRKHIGFMFSKNDPYAGIDLDDPRTKKINGRTIPNENELEVKAIETRHAKIAEMFNSYTELSASGTGVHIIVRGSIPSGVRRDKVEVYSDGRFFIFTGNVLNPSPIADCQELLTQLWQEMGGGATQADLVEVAPVLTDEAVMQMAWNAENRDKFQRLWQGNIDGYPSQSEADFALIAMLSFYTQSNEQVRRLFRQSQLGQRDKATKNDYHIDLSLAKIRQRQQSQTLPLIDFSELEKKFIAPAAPVETSTHVPSNVIFPPGLLGEMADYIYSSAYRPVAEVGLVSALALGAGVVGRQFNISNTGLNQYIMFLAVTGTGKEYTSGGIEALIASVRQQIPEADSFIGPSTFASGQALTRALDKNNCFLSVLGEFGLTLQQICDKRAATHQIQLRKVLLDLFSKSGHNGMLRPSAYSDSEKNTALVRSPAVTILGESTPGRFYDVLDNEHISEGLVPRFFVIEYTGLRPPPNPNAFHPVPEGLKTRLARVFQTVIAMKFNDQFYNVPLDSFAKKLMDEFNLFADDKINGGDDEMIKQVWNRAHLKALKIAGLVAVGCNHDNPVVTKEIASWSLDLVKRDVENMATKFAKGDVGQGDHKCESDIIKAFDKYPGMTPKQRAAYNVPEVLRDKNACVPYVFLKKYCLMRASFKSDRRGAIVALDVALKDMIKAGIIRQIPAPEAKQFGGTDAALYVRGEAF